MRKASLVTSAALLSVYLGRGCTVVGLMGLRGLPLFSLESALVVEIAPSEMRCLPPLESLSTGMAASPSMPSWAMGEVTSLMLHSSAVTAVFDIKFLTMQRIEVDGTAPGMVSLRFNILREEPFISHFYS
jgi:hypothetical protein